MNKETIDLFIAVGRCHRLLQEFVRRIRADRNVNSVTHWMDAIDVETSCRIEEFVDAELKTGDAISWRLELLISTDQIDVESDVRRTHKDGQDCIAEIANEVHLTTESCALALPAIVNALCNQDGGQSPTD